MNGNMMRPCKLIAPPGPPPLLDDLIGFPWNENWTVLWMLVGNESGRDWIFLRSTGALLILKRFYSLREPIVGGNHGKPMEKHMKQSF